MATNFRLPFRHKIIFGRVDTGACSAPGFRVGDQVIFVTNMTDQGEAEAVFEPVITVNDEIQQIVLGDWSTHRFDILVAAFSGNT